MTEEYSSSTEDLTNKFQEWFRDPVPSEPPFPAEIDYSNYIEKRNHVYNLPKLSDLVSFGIGGAILVGGIVGFTLLMLNFSDYRGYINDWSVQLVVLFVAMVFGFFGSLIIGIRPSSELDEGDYPRISYRFDKTCLI